jgi:hypothetical protein
MITSLTPQQQERLSHFREEWLRIGLSTEPADRPMAEAGVRLAYEAAGLMPPEIFIWLDSPRQGAFAAALLSGAKFGPEVRDKVRDKVRAQVGAQVGAQVWAQVWHQVEAQVRAQVGHQVRDKVADQVWHQVWHQVEAQVRAQVWHQVRDKVEAQVGHQVWHQVENAVYGAHDASWLGFYAALAEFGAGSRSLDGMTMVAKSCGWWWPFAGAVILTDRPVEVHFDDERRLHSERGMAVKYRDGWGCHSWHGVSVPARWIQARSDIDPAEILTAQNVEQRAAGIQIVGLQRMLPALNERVVDDSGNPDIGQLIELTVPGLPEPGLFLKAHCPRNGTIIEGVPRVSDVDGLPITTALAAQAWRIGDPLSEYQHPPART